MLNLFFIYLFIFIYAKKCKWHKKTMTFPIKKNNNNKLKDTKGK